MTRQSDRVGIVPGCQRPCRSRERYNTCLEFFRRNHYDRALDLIDKQSAREWERSYREDPCEADRGAAGTEKLRCQRDIWRP